MTLNKVDHVCEEAWEIIALVDVLIKVGEGVSCYSWWRG